MCGIFGVVNRHTLNDGQQAFIKSALQTGQLRGVHGTGLMTADYKGKVTYASAAMTGTEFLDSKQIKPVRNSIRSARSAVGHNRHATVGKLVDKNCHPFHFDNIVGVHNGTVPDNVLKPLDPGKSHEVDSARIFAALALNDDPLDVIPRIHGGAYSLVWYDTNTNMLHLARNGHRPMSLAVTHNGLYFASEMGMMTWLMARHKLGDWGQRQIQFAETDVHTLYSIPLDALDQVVAEKYTVKTPVIHPVAQQTRDAWKNSRVENKPADKKKDKLSPKKEAAAAGPMIPLVPRGVDEIVERFRLRNQKYKTDDLALPPPKEDVSEAPYEHRASKYFTDVDEIEKAYPATAPVVEFIKSNLMYVKGEEYPRAFGSMCSSLDEDNVMHIYGFLSNDIGAKEDRWRAMMRLAAPADSESMRNIDQHLPTWEDVADGVSIMYPIAEAHIFSYELRPTGEIICIGRPCQNGHVELFVPEEDENETSWSAYACGDKYLHSLADSQVQGLWSDLSIKENLNDDIPF